MLSAKFQFIINEKFTSDNKKQNNSRNNIGSIFIQIILCRNLNRSLLHKYKKKRNHCHCPYIKLRKPCYNDRGKSATSRRTCRNRMRRTTYKNKSARPAIPPEIPTVRIITLPTLIPAYRAVFSLSPTTEIS